MVIFDSSPKIFMAKEPIDVRKGIDYLASLVLNQFELNPYDKSLFIFSNKRHNRLKCLYFDGSGFWIFIKRVENGTLKWKHSADCLGPEISEQQLRWILEGLRPEQKRTIPSIHYEFS